MALINNLLAYWKLDESSGNASDITGGGNTLTNNNTVGYTAALINNGADFGTANVDKSLSRTGLIGTDGSYSLSLWVKLRTEIISDIYNFITISTQSTTLEIAYEYNAGLRRIRVTRERNNLPQIYVDKTITLGTANWYHLAVTYNGSNLTLYVDAVAEIPSSVSGNGTANFSPGGGAITIGCKHDANTPGSTSSFASFYVDEIGLWQKELSSLEVSQLSNSGIGNPYPFLDILTFPVTDITVSQAMGNAQIISDGGTTIIERGFCWNTITNPTVLDNKAITVGTTGDYSTTLTGLSSNTLYYVRPYYKNVIGTTYGSEVTFNTLAVNQYDLQKELNATDGETYLGQINVTGTTGTVTVMLGSTGTATVINAGVGVSTFSGTYSGLSGLIITRSADFDGTVDDVFYVALPLGTTVDWDLNTVSIITAIPSEVFFKRIEADVFNSFRFYRYLDLLFKDFDGYVTVTVRQEREDNTTANEKTFSIGNTSSGTVSPFQKKRISFLCKNQAIIIGLSNDAIGETFSIAKYLLIGDQKGKKMFSADKIISM